MGEKTIRYRSQMRLAEYAKNKKITIKELKLLLL
jgi:hypothetical protein